MKRPKTNRRNGLILTTAATVAALFAPHMAQAAPNGGATYQLRARVPVACWVKPVTPLMAETGSVGQVVEACNSPGGFTVSAHYRSLAEHEKAKLTYGSRTLDLARSGSQTLRRANLASIRTIDYRFEDVALDAPLVLSLTIQPI
ncbi:hypothetical protein [Brevundimonas vesicularis]|uniref:hypothetical protein n=1 Tax=Brevundimonas vesicularis TaxID=41276 RepID=UPI0038D501BC